MPNRIVSAETPTTAPRIRSLKRRRQHAIRDERNPTGECLPHNIPHPRRLSPWFPVIAVLATVFPIRAASVVFEDPGNGGAARMLQQDEPGFALLSSASGNVANCTIANGVQTCPITETFVQNNGIGEDSIFLAADVSCPLETVDLLGFRQSSRDGRCSCNVTGYSIESNPDFGNNGQVLPLPSGCDCYVCPYGDGLQLAEFKCRSILAFTLSAACSSFDCGGTCNGPVTAVEQPIGFACPANAVGGEDPCPSREDGVCDSSIGDDPFSADPACAAGDCFDCDPCRIHDYDCGACLAETGCSWCPFEGTCTNAPNLASNNTRYPLCVDAVEAPGNATTQCSVPTAPFSDPLVSAQNWVFDQIDVVPVWNRGLLGSGVRVRINDDGLDPLAPELLGRISANASCIGGASEPLAPEDGRGTAVASVLGASGDNGACAVGIAPNVTFSSCNVLVGDGDPRLAFELDAFDVSQNGLGIPACSEASSSGVFQPLGSLRRRRGLQGGTCPFLLPGALPCTRCVFTAAGAIDPSSSSTADCDGSIIEHCATNFKAEPLACTEFLDLLLGGGLCDYNKVPASVLEDLSDGVTNGRGGKGIVYVVAAGDDHGTGGDVNFSGLTNSRTTIAVGAVRKNDLHASYSTPGAALLVSAPGGDDRDASNHITPVPGGGCTGDSIGTSYASAVVSGVVALVLEANPSLTWREVQGVLAETARPVTQDSTDPSRTTNGAGLTHSNYYGFGIVNATAAVEAAQSWTEWCPEEVEIGASGPINAILPDDPTITVNHTITLRPEQAQNLLAESVAVLLDVRHFSRGDLEVTLTSPSGTESVLHPGRRPETSQLGEEERWKLTTVRNWGESVAGDWTLAVRDLRPGDVTTCSDVPFSIRVFGVDYNCETLTAQRICTNGSPDAEFFATPGNSGLLAIEDEGFTLDTACCACGGGFTTTSFEDELVQWQLVVYGHLDDCSTTVPTLAPRTTFAPVPTVAPAIPVDKEEQYATIAASVIALLVIILILWGTLRDPSRNKKSEIIEETNPKSKKGKSRLGGWKKPFGSYA